MRSRIHLFASVSCLLPLLAACGKDPAPVEPAVPIAEPAPAGNAALPRTPAPEGASVFFVAPADGAIVTGTFRVEFGVEGMSVVRAGDNSPSSGHHHLLIDTGLPDLALPVPADANHVHFGDGSSSTELTLPAGQHTLQLLFADHLHIPHEPPVYSERITVTVE
ncbi:MAG: DUF4399 domain-containing protein [Woeseiaceae bacterium]|nr:DUF4399 domain-containing protein [Woeseiaceae bacterium]